jgi:hypothetical protein
MYLFVKSRSGYAKPGKWSVMYLFVKSRSGYTKPGKWSVMYLLLSWLGIATSVINGLNKQIHDRPLSWLGIATSGLNKQIHDRPLSWLGIATSVTFYLKKRLKPESVNHDGCH